MSFKDLAELEQALENQTALTAKEYIALNKRIDEALQALTENTARSAEMILLYDNLKSAFKVLSWFEVIASWLIKIGGASAIIWGIWKFGAIQAYNDLKLPK